MDLRNSNQDKKGMLLASEMVKIVIAVIAVSFLVYFLSMLYFSKVSENKQVEAKSVLIESQASIKNKIKMIREDSAINQETRELGIPGGWYLFSFTEKDKPNACAGKNCLCICDNVVDMFKRQIKECDKNGACLIIENLDPESNLELKIEAKGEDLTEILIKYDDSKNIFNVEEK